MATAEQVKALVKSHREGDDARFYAVAMQVAAHAARKGHSQLAGDLRQLVDEGKGRPSRRLSSPLVQISRELGELLTVSHPQVHLADMVLEDDVRVRLARVLLETRQRHRLREHGLDPRRKLLLMGPPGSGKTMTASALAGELNLPLMTVVLEGLITRFLGETAAKLRQVFESIARSPAVYLFDEFDALGGHRSLGNDVGEIRRVLSSFLQLLEQDSSDSLIVAATNNPDLLDSALFRRFDDVISYRPPETNLAIQLAKSRLTYFPSKHVDWEVASAAAAGLSHAEIVQACEDAAKGMILGDLPEITTEMLVTALNDRKSGR